MQMLARGYLVYDLTGSASLLGIVSAGSAVPMLVLALFGGAIADRFDRKRLIQIGQLIVGLLALVVGLAIFAEWVRWYHLLISSLIQGAIWSFMMPARQAIIPQVVGPERIGNAMAINAAGMSAMTLMAPALAGGLYALAGPANVYFVIAGLSVLAVVMTSLISPRDVPASTKKRAMLSDIVAGLNYIKGNQMVLVLLVMGLATTLLASPFRMLLPVFVVDIYGRGPDSMGLLVAIMGGGSLVGSLVIAALGNWRRGMLLIVGAFASGIALLLIAAFPFYYAAAAIMLLVGLGDSGRRTINMGLIMESRGGPVPGPGDERVHDELRTHATWNVAGRFGCGLLRWSYRDRHTGRAASGCSRCGPGYAETAAKFSVVSGQRLAAASHRCRQMR